MKKEKNKTKLSFARIISNNIYMLKIIQKGSKWHLPITVTFNLFWAAADFVFYTLMLRYIINCITNNGNVSTLIITLITWAVFQTIIHILNNYYNETHSIYQNNRIYEYVRKLVYEKSAEVDLSNYENPEYFNKLTKAVSECDERTTAVISSIHSLSYRIVRFTANFGLLIAIDPWLLVFALIPLITIPLNAKSNKLGVERTLTTKEVNRRRDYSQRVFYLADYAKEMRLSNLPKMYIKRFREASQENINLLGKYGKKIAIIGNIISFINNISGTIGATVYSVWQTIGVGAMSYGDCVVVINAVDTLAYTLTDTASDILRFQENALYIETLREFLSIEPKIKSGTSPLLSGGDIELHNISFKYDGAKDYTLKNVSMKIGHNEKIAIVGHNGAGKTTLVKLLLRLYDAEGKITYGGTDIKDLDIKEYRNSFSTVMQDFHLYAMSVHDNVTLKLHDNSEAPRVIKSLEKSGLYPKIEKYSNGIDTIMTKEFDENGELLSGGEQQKLSISHVYFKENKFVILDEPSSALDPIAEYNMYKNMTDACSDCGMILISHRLSSAVIADRVYLMENGTVIESGSHTELMQLNGKYATMFRHQAENYKEV